MPEQTSDTRRRGYFIGAAIGAVMLVVILVVTIILLLTRPSSSPGPPEPPGPHSSCQPSPEMPDMDALMRNRMNFASPSYSAIANMIGYVYYYGVGFLPIVLYRVEDDGGSLLSLISECATLNVQYDKVNTENGTIVELNDLNMDLTGEEMDPNGLVPNSSHFITRACVISSDAEYQYPYSMRYSCLNRANIVCRNPADQFNYAPPMAEVVLVSLEFELYATESIHNRQFGRLPQPGGCIAIKQ